MIKVICNGCDKTIECDSKEKVLALQEVIGEYTEDCDFNLLCSEDCRDHLENAVISSF